MKDAYILYNEKGKFLLSLIDTVLDENFKPGFHSHTQLEISFVKSGCGTYYIDDRIYDIKTGDIVLINNTEPHLLQVPSGGHLVNTVIHFEPEFICSSAVKSSLDYGFLQIFFERSPQFSHVLDRQNPATAGIFNLLTELEKELIDGQTGYEMMVKIKLQNVFANIVRYYDYCLGTEKAPFSARDIKIMRNINHFLDSNLDSDITLETLAGIANMSPAYFSTFFKKHNGKAPFEYIAERRVRRAIELIRTTNLSLTDIAFACGFNNTTTFNKAFHRIVGNTPSFYRTAGEEQPTNHAK